MSLSLYTGPTTEPLTWAQLQKQLRQEGLEDDKAFAETVIIPAVRDRGELATDRAFTDQAWDLVLDSFPCERWIEIPKPPLVSVVLVTYVDTSGVTQTWATSNYTVDVPVGPRCRRGRLVLAYGAYWPTTRSQANAVTIRFRCGYVDQSGETPAGPVRVFPPLLLAGLLQDAATIYAHREWLTVDPRVTAAIELPGFSQSIYRSFRSHPTQRLREQTIWDAGAVIR
jgi:uncharacterized phiE125 gp8 family phage protein